MLERQLALEKAQGFRGPATRFAAPINDLRSAELAIRDACVGLLWISLIFFLILLREGFVLSLIVSAVIALPTVALLVSRHRIAGVATLLVPALALLGTIGAMSGLRLGALAFLIAWLYLAGRACRAAFTRSDFLVAEAEGSVTGETLPDRIVIEVTADGRPVPGALVDVTLSMISKNPHTMVLGPADSRGQIVVSRVDLLDRATENCRNFVMDYSDLASRFAGSVDVRPVTPSRLAQMRKIHETFGSSFKYPGDWPAVLEGQERWFSEHPTNSLAARVEVSPPGVRVSTPEVRV